jgi:amino acid transporter
MQGHSLSELAFRSQPGIIGSWVGFAFNCVVLVAQFWVAIAPIGYKKETSSNLIKNFFSLYLALPVTALFYLTYKIWYRTPFIRSHNMDLHTGIRELNIEQLIEEEREERRGWPAWKRVYKFFC